MQMAHINLVWASALCETQPWAAAAHSITYCLSRSLPAVTNVGTLVQLSERPIMCSAASWGSNEVVVGSCDHASYVVDVRQGKKKRTLYTKTTGHTE